MEVADLARQQEAQSRDRATRAAVFEDDCGGDIANTRRPALKGMANLATHSLPKGFEPTKWGRIVDAMQRGIAHAILEHLRKRKAGPQFKGLGHRGTF